MTSVALLAFERSLLAEITAKFWTDAELEAYSGVAITAVSSRYAPSLVILQKKPALVDAVTSTNQLVLPADFWKVIRLEVASTQAKVQYIQDNRNWQIAGLSSGQYVWSLAENGIRIDPAPATTTVGFFRLWYWQEPTTLAQLPSCLHPLVGIEAVRLARFKDEDVQGDLMDMQTRYDNDARIWMAVHQYQEADQISSFDADEVLTEAE